MKTRRNKKIMIVAAVIIVLVIMSGIIYCGRNSEFCLGAGTVTEKEQKGNEYFTTVNCGKLEKTFEGKTIYDFFEEQEEIVVVLLKKKVFDFAYETKLEGLTGSKK